MTTSFRGVCLSKEGGRDDWGRGVLSELSDLTPKDPPLHPFLALSTGLLSEGLLGSLENLPLLNVLKTGGGTSGGLLGGLLGKVTSVVPLMSKIIE